MRKFVTASAKSSTAARTASSVSSSIAHFAYARHDFAQFTQDVLAYARQCGADDCAVEISESTGLTVNVRKNRVETIEQNRDKGVGITVYIGTGKNVRRGHASTSDFSSKALHDTVDAAYNIARFTAQDDCAALPEEELFEHHPRDFDLYHPWNISAADAIKIGQHGEAAALSLSPLICNSDGASVSAQHAHFLMANSRGFMGGYAHSSHSISVAPIAGRHPGDMQRDHWYVSQRDPADLASPEAIGRYAAQRTLARLGAVKLTTRRAPVLFDAPLAAGLLGSFTQAISGGALYRKASFLVDSLGQAIFPDHIDIIDDPYIIKGAGSASFDSEGVRTQRRHIVEKGVVQGYFLSTYSARKLAMQPTGNAGGSHNLLFKSRKTRASDDFCAMLKKLGTGLLVTDLMGQGMNYVTGDYSRGASGFWVENGAIAYPVEEITIAGNLRDIFQQIVAVGADTLIRGNKTIGSLLVEQMAIAGS